MRKSHCILIFCLLTLLGIFSFFTLYSRSDIRIASKRFPESRLLLEIMAQLIEEKTDLTVERKNGLGGTLICFQALIHGEIDIYPEYTGTGWTAILKQEEKITDPEVIYDKVKKAFSEKYDLEWLSPFGFNNTYALAVPADFPAKKASDLEKYKEEIQAGFTHEFLKRPDGYPGLAQHYGFSLSDVKGLDHGLAYLAISQGEINLIDAYSTDGKIAKYKLKILKDDKAFFPPYYAAPLVNKKTLQKYPQLREALKPLANILDDEKMTQLNYLVEVEKQSFSQVAQQFLTKEGLAEKNSDISSAPKVDLLRLTRQHLYLTFMATTLSILVAVPLGLLISKFSWLAAFILGVCGVIQTIPSLAILGFMIPIFGIGIQPAIAALFLYGLLPIVRNTYTGIQGVSGELKEAALGMGMTSWQIMFYLELPLATKIIMAGIRTAVVINIGTATLAAFIGAGGLGEPIVTGLSLNDNDLILWGAIPAAILALVVDFALARIENFIEPTGLQIDRTQKKS